MNENVEWCQAHEDCRQFWPVSRYGAYALLESFLTDEEFENLDDDGWAATIQRMLNALEQGAPFGTFKPDAEAECGDFPSDVAVGCVH